MPFSAKRYFKVISISAVVFCTFLLIYPAFNCHEFGISKEGITEIRMEHLLVALNGYIIDNGITSNITLREITSKLTAGDKKYLFPKPEPRKIIFWKSYPDFLNKKGELVDGWGNPFQIKIDVMKSKILIKSLGENGTDDNGEGDDIVVTSGLQP